MKKRILLAIGLILPMLLIVAPQMAGAVDVLNPVCNSNPDNPNPPNDSAVCKDSQPKENPLTGPNGVLTKAIQIIAIVVGIGAVFVMIISGVRMILSGGDPARVSGARNGAIFGLVGLAIALMAQAIVTFVLKKLS